MEEIVSGNIYHYERVNLLGSSDFLSMYSSWTSCHHEKKDSYFWLPTLQCGIIPFLDSLDIWSSILDWNEKESSFVVHVLQCIPSFIHSWSIISHIWKYWNFLLKYSTFNGTFSYFQWQIKSKIRISVICTVCTLNVRKISILTWKYICFGSK